MLKISLLALLFTTQTFAQSVQPGIWKADSDFKVNGISLPSSHDEECVSAEDAKDLRRTLSKELTKQGCNITKWLVDGKKLNITLECKKDGLEATGNLQGLVTTKSYDLAGEAEGTFHRIPSRAKLHLKGQWIKNCAK